MKLKRNRQPLTGSGEKTGKAPAMLSISWIRSSIILGVALGCLGLAAILAIKILNFGETQLFLDAKAFVKEYGLLGVFLATILAGTIVPLGSPAFVVAAASFGLHPTFLAIVATVGFTIGMMINYVLAYSLGRPYVIKKVGEGRLEEISSLWRKWGWILYTVFGLIPFLPVEFLSLFCGLLKVRLDIFLLLSFMPRLVVFAVLAYFGEHLGFWLGIV
ncbi:MAG: VTT domain-containing protein [Nitrososphaerota archaeon]|nr:VTT domain-containing protein [Candidatus Bathyarchaeota archaeon]MDW8023375.1 VTT domain-containing protein [Nitrososphaerota archaeon]